MTNTPGDGQPPQDPYQQQPDQSPGYGQDPSQDQSGQPYAAMITGIVSLVLACGYGVGLLASPVAWYLGKSSMNRIDASQGQLGGRGMAQAGMILGIVGTVLLVLAIVAVVVIFGLVAGSSSP